MNTLRSLFAIVARWYSRLGALAKAAAAVGTIVSAGTAVFGVYSAIHDEVVRREMIAADIRQAESQLRERDYYLAWTANGKVLELAPASDPARDQQARIAMAWLENFSMNSKPGASKWSDIADPLLAALAARAVSPSVRGVALADIKAHIGWARFLKSRDGISGLRIADEFAEALRIDPANMYAHVMNGFFILWDGGAPSEARPDFDEAMKSPVDPAYRDTMVLRALFNFHTDEHNSRPSITRTGSAMAAVR